MRTTELVGHARLYLEPRRSDCGLTAAQSDVHAYLRAVDDALGLDQRGRHAPAEDRRELTGLLWSDG